MTAKMITQLLLNSSELRSTEQTLQKKIWENPTVQRKAMLAVTHLAKNQPAMNTVRRVQNDISPLVKTRWG